MQNIIRCRIGKISVDTHFVEDLRYFEESGYFGIVVEYGDRDYIAFSKNGKNRWYAKREYPMPSGDYYITRFDSERKKKKKEITFCDILDQIIELRNIGLF
jgi:hypothetical protein